MSNLADEQDAIKTWYRQYRRYLAAVAYRMLGSWSEAEDVVQDVFLRLHNHPVESIREAKSYLTKMAVTRSLDVLKSARRRRETYVGPWLPEPDVQFHEEINERLIIEETISYALLVVLERLTPNERAVFLLVETLGYAYRDVSEMLQKTEVGCRKLMSRARKKLAQDIPIEPIDLDQGRELTLHFLRAAQTGRVEELLTWLVDDAICYSDGGGIVHAAVRPIVGADRAASFLIGLSRGLDDDTVQLIPLIVNGEAGFGVLENGQWTTVIAVHWLADKVKHIYMIRNPYKLKHLTLQRENNI